jgi:predicted permease
MHTLWQDVRYGLRLLLKSPGFAITAILTLALGIGASTAIFSVVYAALLKPLPYPQPDRIVRVWQVDDKGYKSNISDPNFEDLRDGTRSFSSLAEYSSSITETVSLGRDVFRMNCTFVSKQFFDAMGIQPVIGRGFLPEETRFGGSPVVLVSNSFWKSSLGGDSDLSTKRVTFEGKSYPIAGVLPPGFHFPGNSDFWVPREQLERYPSRTALNWRVLGRLRQGVELEQARTDLSGIARNLKRQLGDDTGMSDAAILPLQEALVGDMRTSLLFLLGAAGLLLLAACANTANLLIARSASRQREFAVRAALGASKSRLTAQFLTESLLLSLGGAILGVLFSIWGIDALLSLDPGHLPSTVEVHLNLPVLAFSLFLSIATACGLGLALTMRATRNALSEDLKAGQQRQSSGKREVRVRAVLMASQVAVATVLLAGAALLSRSLVGLMQVNPGFRAENTLAIEVFPPEAKGVTEKAHRVQEIGEILQRLKGIPGVDAAGVVGDLPIASAPSNGTFLLMENQQELKGLEDFERIMKIPGRTGEAFYQVASRDYFSAMQIPLMHGRLFDERDGPDAPHAALINESLARERWPGQDPIGHHIEFGNMDGDLRLLQIVGIVGDVHGRSLDVPAEPMIYVNYAQRMRSHYSIVVHSAGFLPGVVAPARSLLREIDPSLAPNFRVFPEIISQSLGNREFQLCLIAAFAIGALGLAVLGLYGVTSYLVNERTQEIGVRIAIGAQPGDVLKLILSQSGRVVLIGIALGVIGNFAIADVLRSLLYGIKPSDPATIAAVCGLLGLLALFACWVPARRATKVDPIVALRYE